MRLWCGGERTVKRVARSIRRMRVDEVLLNGNMEPASRIGHHTKRSERNGVSHTGRLLYVQVNMNKLT